jgi:hypothetical protein
MDNSVTMALKDYDALKEKVKEYEQHAIDKQLELMGIKIFKLEKSYNGSLTLKLADDAEQFLKKAFAEFRKEYDIKKESKDIFVWDYAVSKVTADVESKPEEIF